MDPRSAIPVSSTETVFPDPADTGVFWAQPLVLALEQEAEAQAYVIEPEMFRPFFSRFYGGGVA
jgi:hypothetical protein